MLRTGILALALASAAMPLYAEAERVIRVDGTGEVTAAPDMAVITVGTRFQDKTAGAAMEQVTEAQTKVIEALKLLGISGADVQTRSVTVNPVWADRQPGTRPKIAGFEAGNTVMVRVTSLENLGFVIDRVLSEGANQMDGLVFGISEDKALRDQARKAAVADAISKAQLYALAAGVELGPVQEITESGSGGFIEAMDGRAMMAMAKAAPIEAGELTINANVGMVFGIRDPE